jgi:hypothetical protein
MHGFFFIYTPFPAKEIGSKNQELDVAALRTATSNLSLGREYGDI